MNVIYNNGVFTIIQNDREYKKPISHPFLKSYDLRSQVQSKYRRCLKDNVRQPEEGRHNES